MAQSATSAAYIMERDILPVLPDRLRKILRNLKEAHLAAVEEIRLREGRPLMLSMGTGDTMVDESGQPTSDRRVAVVLTREDLSRSLQLMTGGSVYTLEEELRMGFLTLRGGHRVGLVGRALLEGGRVRALKHIAGINIRLSRQLLGAADGVMEYILNPAGNSIFNTLIISPPGGGKTTLLRDVIRQLSEGVLCLNFQGVKVGVVDERSELAGCYQGVPQLEVGVRTDVLDACPKAEGMMMLIRSMSPTVLATDEIGRQEDISAIREALCAGVKVVATAHASTIEELRRRPHLGTLLRQKMMERVIVLGRSQGPGTLELVYDGELRVLYRRNLAGYAGAGGIRP